jgi:hypothetical protein
MNTQLRAQLESSEAEVASLSRRIEKISDVTDKDVLETARIYSRERSAVLVGIIGGVIGSVGGIGVTTVAGGMALVGGPLGMALGAALAIYVWRGNRYHNLERGNEHLRLANQRLELALEPIRKMLHDLPDDAPASLKLELLSQQEAIIRTYYLGINTSLATDLGVRPSPPGNVIEVEAREANAPRQLDHNPRNDSGHRNAEGAPGDVAVGALGKSRT